MTTRKKTGHRRGGGGSNVMDQVPDFTYFAVNNELWGRPGGGGGGARTRRSGGGALPGSLESGLHNYFGDIPYGGGGAKAEGRAVVRHVMHLMTKDGFKLNVEGPLARDAASENPLRDKIRRVIDKFPKGSDVNAVNRALAKIGACFAPWSDGLPGNYSASRHPYYK